MKFKRSAKMATYRDIQNWVKSNYGFNVRTCWIAHVREICGLKPRQASNRINKNKRTNPCPQEKMDSIKEALKHFKMI